MDRPMATAGVDGTVVPDAGASLEVGVSIGRDVLEGEIAESHAVNTAAASRQRTTKCSSGLRAPRDLDIRMPRCCYFDSKVKFLTTLRISMNHHSPLAD